VFGLSINNKTISKANIMGMETVNGYTSIKKFTDEFDFACVTLGMRRELTAIVANMVTTFSDIVIHLFATNIEYCPIGNALCYMA